MIQKLSEPLIFLINGLYDFFYPRNQKNQLSRRRQWFRLFFLFSIFIIHHSLFNIASATHLMGGNITYKYLGETFPGSNQFQYEITLVTFQDCNSQYWTPNGSLPDNIANIGIFQGNAIPASPLPFVANLALPLVDSGAVAPPLPSGCVIPSNPCIYQVTYRNTITLPISFSGYHIYYDRCCRNNSIVNLNQPGEQGMVFHAYIPPTIVANSSPVFTDMPVPFICVNDTTGILNTAVDPDGDLLIFSFENPYEGEYTGNGMGGNPSPAVTDYSVISPINVPFPTVIWAGGGFNKNSPFGPSGYAFINSFTGYTEYKPTAIGNFVIAVEIKEYRNGNLIGITRRDMQLLVTNCPQNLTPVLSSAGGSGTTSYTIEEGNSICFPITFTDANTFTITSTGNIFNSSFTSPPATINTPVTGNGSATANFCWNTGCNQGQTLPYLFNVAATDNGCPPKTTPVVYSITVNNFNGPTTITGTNTVCPGISGLSYSTSFIAGATYNWTVTGGTISSGQGTNSILVNWGNGPSGNVSVTATSQFGCSSSPINLPVSFNAAVDVVAGPDKSICAGDTISIGGSPTAPSGAILTWSPSTGLSNPNIQNPVASPNSTTTYIATATNSSGCSDADTVVVTVNSIPDANAGNDTTVCLNNSVQLNASGGTTYEWFPSTNLSCTNCQNPIANPSDTTTYYVIVSSAENCKDTDSVTVFIQTETPADAGNDKTICEGDSVQIGGSMQVPPGATISWTPNISLSSNSILNPKAAPAITTTYILSINASGCLGTDSVTVNVNPIPLANAGNDTLICDGDTVLLTATSSPAAAFQWFPATGLSNPNSLSTQAFPLSSTQYIFTATENNCSNSDTILLQVFSSTVNVTADTGICFGDTITLSATASGNASFLWSPAATLNDDDISNPNAFPANTTKYFVQATDTNNCSSIDSVTISVNPLPVADAGNDAEICLGDSAQLIASGGILFLWNTGDTTSTLTLTSTSTSTFFVTVTDSNNCSNTDSVKIFVNELPVIQISNDTTVCENDTVQILANCPACLEVPTFLWNTGDTTSTLTLTLTSTSTFFVTITDENNCSNTDSIQIDVNELPVVDAGNEINSCKNSGVVLGGSPTAPAGSLFLWTPSINLNDSTLANPTATPDTTTIYYVNVIDSNGCKNSDSTVVSIFSIQTISDTSFCRGESVQLFVSPVSANYPVTYLWSPDSGLNSTVDSVVIASPDSDKIYMVIVTDAKGCSETKNITLTANSPPIADFEFILSPFCDGVFAEFKNKSSSDASSFQWKFGDGKISFEENVNHIFAYNQLMNVSLTAFNEFCKNEKTFNENIKNFTDYFNYYPPNVFTPNNDGQNDCFEINSVKVQNFEPLHSCAELRVFNRWGELMFLSGGNQHRWCGKNFAGEDVPAGTYFYIFDINGILFKGSLMLIR